MATLKRHIPGSPKVEDLLVASKEMAKYIHSHGLNLIIVGGAGAQVAAYMVKQQWKSLFPKESLPRFCAIAQLKGFTHGIAKEVGEKAFAEQLLEKFPFLRASLHEPVFVLEEFAFHGEAIMFLERALKEIGFRKIRKGVMCIRAGEKSKAVAKMFDYAYASSEYWPEFDFYRRFAVGNAVKHRQEAREALRKKDFGRRDAALEKLAKERSKLKSFRERSRAHRK